MADKIKGITIEFGGETQKLESAIKDVNKKTKELNSSLRDVDQALKLNPKSIELITQKQELMGKRVKANVDRVKDLKDIQEKLKAQGVSRQSEEWSKVSLEIEKASSALERAKQEQEEFNFKVSKLGKASESFGKIGSKIEGAGHALSGISTAAVGAIAGLGALAVKGAQNADELITNAKITHLTTEELQRLAYATDLLDVSQETVFKSLSKLTATMGHAAEGGKAQKAMFKQLGVSIKDSDGKLKSSKQTFDEVIDALGKIENVTERDALAMGIFGKSASELNPLIEAGSNAINELSAGAVNIIPEESIQKMGEFDDAVQEMKADSKAAFAELGGQLAVDALPIMKELVQVVKNVSKAIGKMSPEVRKAVIVFLGAVAVISPLLIWLGKLFGAIKSIIEFMPLVGEAFSFLASALSLPVIAISALVGMFIYAYKTSEDFRNRISEHIEAIKGIFGSLGTFFTDVFSGNFISAFENLRNALKSWADLGPELIKTFFEAIKVSIGSFVGWVSEKIGVDLLTPFNAFMDFISTVAVGIAEVFSSIYKFFVDVFLGNWSQVWDAIGGKVKGAFDAVLNFVKSGVNSLIGFINGMIGGLNKIKLPKFLGGGGINIPLIPKLSVGTDKVLSDGLAYLHKGEQVVPSKVVSGGYSGGNLTAESIVQAMKEVNFELKALIDIDGREVAERVSYIHGIDLKRQGG